MATPIPYLVKKGDSLSKIAGELGIDNWQNLRTYHNNNCQPISEQIGEQLKEGKTLLTPSSEEIDAMNGKSREIVQEKEEEEKEIQSHEDDKEEEKQKEAEKGEHDNKYFVVHGAKCFCDQSEVPKKLADLQVTSHSKVVYNDEEGKYAATEEDKTFLPPALTFGNCKLKPNGSGGYLPCSVTPAPKWDKPYDKTKILGKKVLTEISELKCTVGGKIAIEKHGQTDSVLTQHAENTNALELAMTNPALKIPLKKSEIPNVTHIVAKKIENHSDFKEIASNEEKSVEKIIARPHEEITFEAKVKTGNKKLVSWLVYEGHEGKKEQRIFMREQIGHEFKNSFEAGKYRVEGYGSPKEAGNDKNYASISLDIEVTNNKLSGSSLTPVAKDFTIDENGKHKLRKGFPAKFKAEFLIPPTAEELSKIKIYLTDETGNILDKGIQTLNSFVFTPKNSTAKYNIVAEYIDIEGNLNIQTFSCETASNSVLGISHSDEIVRPLSNLQFSVTKTRFNVLVKSDADLTIPELSEIKWNLNGQLIGTGRTIAVPVALLAKPGDYVIEAFAISSNGFGRNAKKENDDWHFKVSENDVVSFTQNTIPKVGKWITFTADKFVFQNLLPNEKVNWHIEGGDKMADSTAIKFKPANAGIKNISCKINSKKGIRQSIEIKQAVINDVMFTDSSGLKIEKASWGQKINIWIDQKELIGEKLEIQLRDSDTFDDDSVAPIITIASYDGKLIPINLDQNIKNKAGKHGELYVKVNAPDLTATHESKKLGKLDVQDKTEIYNAQLGSEDGKEKHFLVDYDEISWFYAQSRGIKPEQKLYLEIRKAIKGTHPLLLYQDNVKADESGVIRQKIVWNNINNKINFLTVYAMVRENDKNGKVLYDADGSFSMATSNLMKNSILMKVPNNKSAVMVEASNVPSGSKSKCPRCKKLTEAELKAVFPGVKNSSLITEIVLAFNNYSEKFNVNSCNLKAHFFAQAKQESGDTLIPAINGESMDYGINGLLNTGFKNVSSSNMFGKKDGVEMANDLGRKKMEKSLSIDRQIKIANFVYGLDPKAKDLGNKAPNDNQDLSDLYNEGWRYRGRGMLQITGKSNYTNIENHVNSILGKNDLDIKSGRKYDSKFTPTEALLSGFGDWNLHKMYVPAKKGTTKDACLAIIKIINSATKSKTKRVAHLLGGTWYEDDKTSGAAHTIKKEASMNSIFRVDECLDLQSGEPSKSGYDGKWHDPMDNCQRTKYNFEGNKNIEGGAFGKVRNSETKNHQGIDLFAIPDKNNVYACAEGKVVENRLSTSGGNVVTIKVEDKQILIDRKKELNYKIEFDSKGDKGEQECASNFSLENDDNIYIRYYHLSESNVKNGDLVKAGDIIGISGATGNASGTKGPHLHFEILNTTAYPKGLSNRMNPAFLIKLKSIDDSIQDEAKKYRYYKDNSKK